MKNKCTNISLTSKFESADIQALSLQDTLPV